MKLSIITVNLNNYDGLRQTIDSVISQTFTDFEWIVVDGGSSDGSQELIESNSVHFTWWVSEPDSGVYNAMNKGVAHTTGDYLLFLNSGDRLNDKNTLQKVFSFNYSDDILYGDCIFDKNGQKTITRVKEDNLSLYSLVHTGFFHPATFIRRNLLIDNPYNERYKIVSDMEFFLKQYISGKSFHHLDLVVAKFDTTGMSCTETELIEQERQTVFNELLPQYVINELTFTDEFVEGQLSEVRRLRDKGKIFKALVSFNVICMRIIARILSKQKR